MIIITVPHEYNGKKLDRFLRDQFPKLPMSAIYKALRKKDIRINDVKINENITLKASDSLTIYIKDEILYGLNSTNDEQKDLHPIEIVYEDEHLLLVNKQPGISVHPDKHANQDTLIDMATRYLNQNKDYISSMPNTDLPALCHRLDHYTGGIVIIAKTKEALRIMLEKIKNREVKKYYQCLVKGCPSPMEGELKHFLVKNELKSRVYMHDIPQKGGLTAITKYKVTKPGDIVSHLEVELITGRTHQIRAHLSYIGHPILGDDKYGDRRLNKQFGVKHQCLWAYKVMFDFKDAGILNYLKGKVFETNNIQFPIK
ncbi:RluA family pseudouridine synthase [Petroclostridium sp. X23]|uniref:RluA family pseudouridine synthase n=1 Tax=Petroclostridium sp. X23 TaxID=3045146 RepID=UPI0024AE1D33|nr:RluA family pseudouridine synthase [Petroclostridium sp. X23]WHH61439.1 RluA family pseudouridine synthase [Petroclostridium sp. X23]